MGVMGGGEGRGGVGNGRCRAQHQRLPAIVATA